MTSVISSFLREHFGADDLGFGPVPSGCGSTGTTPTLCSTYPRPAHDGDAPLLVAIRTPTRPMGPFQRFCPKMSDHTTMNLTKKKTIRRAFALL